MALPQNMELVNKVEEIAAKKDATPGQIALGWLHAQGEDVFPVSNPVWCLLSSPQLELMIQCATGSSSTCQLPALPMPKRHSQQLVVGDMAAAEQHRPRCRLASLSKYGSTP